MTRPSPILDASGRPFQAPRRPRPDQLHRRWIEAQIRQQRHNRLAYEAARGDRTVPAAPRSGSADSDLLGDLRQIRDRSRQLVRDDAHAAAAVRVLLENVVGCGITPQPAVNAEDAGITQAQADDFNEKAEALWKDWSANQADANEISDFDELTRQIYRCRLVDGEALVHRVSVPGPGRTLRTAWELIDPDRLDQFWWPSSMMQVAAQRGGVEFGDRGQPMAYWILPVHPDDLRWATGRIVSTSLQPERIERQKAGWWNLLHVYRRERPGQSRGIPFLSAVEILFHHLHEYLGAEIVAARMNANMGLVIEQPLDETDPDLVQEDGFDDGSGEQQRLEGLDEGTVHYLNPGEKMQPWIPNRPGQTFEPFVVRVLRAICSALGLAYEMVVKDFKAMGSYSSSRVGLLEMRRGFECEQQWLAMSWLRPSWETMVREGMMLGLLPVFPSALRNPRAFYAVQWIYGAWGWVDPTKEVEAATLAVNANLETPQHAAARAGIDYEEGLRARGRSIKLQEQIEDEMGLQRGALSPTVAQPVRVAAAEGEAPPEPDQGTEPASGGKPQARRDQPATPAKGKR